MPEDVELMSVYETWGNPGLYGLSREIHAAPTFYFYRLERPGIVGYVETKTRMDSGPFDCREPLLDLVREIQNETPGFAVAQGCSLAIGDGTKVPVFNGHHAPAGRWDVFSLIRDPEMIVRLGCTGRTGAGLAQPFEFLATLLHGYECLEPRKNPKSPSSGAEPPERPVRYPVVHPRPRFARHGMAPVERIP